MAKKKTYISLEEAIKKTEKAGFNINYLPGQTVAGDLFELKESISASKHQIQTIHWIFSVFLVALLLTIFVVLSDYFQFLSHSYRDFNQTMNEEKIDRSDINSIKTDLRFIKQNLQNSK